MNKYQYFVLCQLAEDLEPDCEDYYLAEIEATANDCDKYKQALNEIREYLLKHLDLGVSEELDYYVIRQYILQIIDMALGGNNG